MIFKTIDDETTLSGQRIVGKFKARKIAQEQATKQLNTDIQCLKDYENACKSGTVSSEDFTRIMGKASTQAQEYSKNIKDGTGSAQIYADKQKTLQKSIQNTGTASKVAAVGVKALSIAGNMLAGMAISFAISKVIEGIEYLATASERAIEKTKELQQEISQISSDYQSERQTLEGLREEYDALTSKIGENGAEASLSADEYERYRDITSEILDITPKLITGWDDEGSAISDKNDLLQESIDLLDEEYQKSLRNATTRPKLEEIASGIIAQKEEHDKDPYTKTFNDTTDALVNGFINDLKQIESEGKADEYKLVETMWQYLDPEDYAENYNNFWYDGIDTYEQLRDLIDKVGYDVFAESFANEDNPIYQYFSSEQVNELIKRASEYKQQVELIEGEEEQIYQQYKDTLYDCAKAVGDGYDNLDESTKSGITQMINSFDYSDMTEKKFSDMGTDLKDFVDKLSTDDTLRSYFNNLFKPMGEDESIEDYETRVKTGIDEITSYCESNYPAIKLSFGDVEKNVEKLQKQYDNAITKAKDKFKSEPIDITPYKEALDDEYQKIQDWGLEDYADKIKNGTIQSVFGNVDMDKRTIITWSDELKQTYADALASWDYAPEVGSIDTVFGGSSRFGEELNGVGWEVAFTPILPDGTFLSQDTVYDYINTILEEAYADDGKVTEDELVKIDAQGRQIGNTFVQGIFAGIDDSQNYDNNGNWAETVGRLMHFSGDFGAVQIAKDAIEKAKKQEAGFDWDSWFKENSINTQEEIDRWNEIAESATNAADARKKYTEGEEGDARKKYTEGEEGSYLEKPQSKVTNMVSAQEALKTALSEQNSTGTISADTLETLQKSYGGIDKALEMTSNGIVINTTALAKLNKEQKKELSSDLEKNQKVLEAQYRSNSLQIAAYNERLKDKNNLTDEEKESIENSISALEAQQNTIKGQVTDLKSLSIEYENLTSKHNAFIDALSSADAGSGYDSIVNGLEQVQEAWDNGDVGKDEVRTFVDYMSYEDMSTASIDEITKKFENAKKRADELFTLDGSGLKKFLSTLEGDGYAKKNGNQWIIDIDDMDEAAKKFGVSVDALQDGLNKLKDKGFEINFPVDESSLADAQTTVENLNKKIAKLKQKKVKINNDEIKGDIKEIDDQINTLTEQRKTIQIHIETVEEDQKKTEDAINKIRDLYSLTISGIASDALPSIRQQMQQIADENGLDLNVVLKTSTDGEDEKDSADKLKEKVEGLDLSTDIKVNAQTEEFDKVIKDVTSKKKTDVEIHVTNPDVIENIVKNYVKNNPSKDDDKSSSDSSGNSNNSSGSGSWTGSAYAKGNWTIGSKNKNIGNSGGNKSLVGELGTEILVRNGEYHTVGENGAELIDVKKDDIIFNHVQTKHLLENGHINSRGKAYAQGKAYYNSKASGSGNASNLDKAYDSVKEKIDKKDKKSSDNDKETKKTKETTKQLFDWIEKKLNYLANKTQKTIDKINNYVSQRTKKGLYKTLLNNIQDEIDANDKATKKYTQKANSVTISKDKKKDAALKQKLRTGAIKGSTKDLIQEYGEETAEKMEKYLSWYEKAQSAKQTAREKRQELLDKKREALDSQIEYDNNELDRLKTTADKYQYNIDLAEAKGLSSSKKSYTDLIKNSKDQISNLKDQNSELKEYQKGLKKGSVEWYDIQKQIDDNNSSIQDLTKSQVEWNAEIRRIPLKVVQSMADLLESVKSSVQGLIDLRKQLNKYTNLSDVKKEISLKRQDIYYKTRDMQELTRGDLNEALTNEGLNDTQKQQYVKYLEQLAKGDITEGKFFELISKLGISKNDYNRNTLLKDTTKSILDDYSTILSDTSEIDQLAEGYIDTQISKLQEQRDLLKDINDEKSKALELEKKQQALQEAKQNKTNLIYHEGFGFSYEADQSAINDAQRDLDDYNFELDQEQFDKAINILEEIRDNKSYVELRENGDTFLPNIDQWVGSIVKSLSSANISLNFSLDKDGNISTSPKLAKGTKYAKGGMSIVGENGIEMRLLNQGDAILPHDVTENLWEFGLNPQQMIMDNLNIKIPDYSNLVVPKGFNTSNVVHIENISLPNINDLSKAQELFDGLMTISSDAIQHANKR